MEERILNKAEELFFSYGLRGVTMETISKDMGISKKTLYQYFTDKDHIVERVISNLLAKHLEEIDRSRINALNPVHEVVLQLQAIIQVFLDITPIFFTEIQKYAPATWCKIMSHEKEALLGAIKINLNDGISQQLYRSELNIDITALFRLNQLKSIFTPAIYHVSYYDVRQLAYHLTDLYLHGITTEESKTLINTYLRLQA